MWVTRLRNWWLKPRHLENARRADFWRRMDRLDVQLADIERRMKANKGREWWR